MRLEAYQDFRADIARVNSYILITLASYDQFSRFITAGANQEAFFGGVDSDNPFKELVNLRVSDLTKRLQAATQFFLMSSILYSFTIYETFIGKIVREVIESASNGPPSSSIRNLDIYTFPLRTVHDRIQRDFSIDLSYYDYELRFFDYLREIRNAFSHRGGKATHGMYSMYQQLNLGDSDTLNHLDEHFSFKQPSGSERAYRFKRYTPGQQIALAVDDSFFCLKLVQDLARGINHRLSAKFTPEDILKRVYEKSAETAPFKKHVSEEILVRKIGQRCFQEFGLTLDKKMILEYIKNVGQ